jgi:PPOX class probable F420-dependent enzyme
MTDLADFANVAGGDHNFCVMTTTRADGTIQASVVTAALMKDAVVFVARGGSRKLANLRARPNATIVASSGGMWVAVEGTAELVGPDDNPPPNLRQLLRDAFTAAGGTHDDWDEYDRVMAEDRRAIVFITPTRVYSNA